MQRGPKHLSTYPQPYESPPSRSPSFSAAPSVRFFREAWPRYGSILPYLITGVLNQHPRAGIAFNESKRRGDVIRLYDSLEHED